MAIDAAIDLEKRRQRFQAQIHGAKIDEEKTPPPKGRMELAKKARQALSVFSVRKVKR